MIRILLIDNDKERQKRICQNLNQLGYDTVTVQNSIDFSEKIKTTGFDLILIDVNLPDLEFKQDIEIIKEYNPSTNIVALTGTHFLRTNRHVKYIKQTLGEVILKSYKIADIIFGIEESFQKYKNTQKADNRKSKTLTPEERHQLREKRHRNITEKRLAVFTQKFLSKHE